MRLDPLAIRLPARKPQLDFLIRNDAFGFQIDQQHTAGLQTALVPDILGLDWQDACFRGHDQDIVVRDQVSCRPQTVSVESRAYYAAIRECDRSGTVPWFHQRSVILVKRTLLIR